MSKLRKAARGQDCMVRIPGYCNFRPETTVLAHLRIGGMGGVGMKPHDLIGAWACSGCHDVLDGRNPTTDFTKDELRMMHFEGMARTIERLAKMGVIDTTGGDAK